MPRRVRKSRLPTETLNTATLRKDLAKAELRLQAQADNRVRMLTRAEAKAAGYSPGKSFSSKKPKRELGEFKARRRDAKKGGRSQGSVFFESPLLDHDVL